MFVFILVLVSLIVIIGLCVMWEKDNNRTHYATWLEVIERHERLGFKTKEELEAMKAHALVLKQQYSIKD